MFYVQLCPVVGQKADFPHLNFTAPETTQGKSKQKSGRCSSSNNTHYYETKKEAKVGRKGTLNAIYRGKVSSVSAFRVPVSSAAFPYFAGLLVYTILDKANFTLACVYKHHL